MPFPPSLPQNVFLCHADEIGVDNNRVPDKERLWDVETHRGLKPNEQSVAENNSVGLKSRAFWLKDHVTVSSLLVFRVQLFFLIVNEAGSTLPTQGGPGTSLFFWRLATESRIVLAHVKHVLTHPQASFCFLF